MTNDDYFKWRGLLYKVAKKYICINSLYELEDLIQIGSIGLATGLETYEDGCGVPLKNWLANNISWSIHREINRNRSIDTPISLDTLLRGNDDDLTLEEVIADEKIDVQAEIESALMIEYYENECKKALNEKEFNICYLKWFQNYSYKAIEEALEAKNINSTLTNSRIKLIQKSIVFRNEYKKLHHIDEYTNPSTVIV